jgi:hypothetical protein
MDCYPVMASLHLDFYWDISLDLLWTSYSTIRLNVLEALAFKAIVHIDAPRSNFMLVM